MVDSVGLAADLAAKENGLWALTEKHNFKDIQAKDGAMSGEDLVLKVVDKYFAETKFADIPKPVTDLSFLKADKDKVEAFAKANPAAVAGLVEYAQQYVAIGEATQTLNKSLVDGGLSQEAAEKKSGEVIVAVDKRYEEGGPKGKDFDANKVATDTLKPAEKKDEPKQFDANKIKTLLGKLVNHDPKNQRDDAEALEGLAAEFGIKEFKIPDGVDKAKSFVTTEQSVEAIKKIAEATKDKDHPDAAKIKEALEGAAQSMRQSGDVGSKPQEINAVIDQAAKNLQPAAGGR